jgi:hypothetical protein
MALTITPYNNNNYRNNTLKQQNPAFTAKIPVKMNEAETALEQATNSSSSFFAPINKAYESFTD